MHPTSRVTPGTPRPRAVDTALRILRGELAGELFLWHVNPTPGKPSGATALLVKCENGIPLIVDAWMPPKEGGES